MRHLLFKQEEDRLLAASQALRERITSLQQRKSCIPLEELRLRAELAHALDIPEDDMPFIGDLLKVRDNETAWEGTIERLLRGNGH